MCRGTSKLITLLVAGVITTSCGRTVDAGDNASKPGLRGSKGGVALELTSVRVLAGSGKPGSVDGKGASAMLNRPHGLALGQKGIVYFADRGNHQIRSVNLSSQGVVTLAGDGTAGYLDEMGKLAQFNQPIAVIASQTGAVYVADRENHRIRKIDTDGRVSTLAGTGVAGFKDGKADEAQFNQPYGVALDLGEKALYVADYLNHSIRKIDLQTGRVVTLVGNGTAGNVDGAGTAARFNQPYNIKFDGVDSFFIPDQKNHSIRKLTMSGKVTTIAGNGTAGYADGKGTSAQFNNPTGLAIGPDGKLYVADRENHRIRQIAKDSSVTTLTGTGREGDTDGALSVAEFRKPIDIVCDKGTKSLLVSEENGHRIRMIQ